MGRIGRGNLWSRYEASRGERRWTLVERLCELETAEAAEVLDQMRVLCDLLAIHELPESMATRRLCQRIVRNLERLSDEPAADRS